MADYCDTLPSAAADTRNRFLAGEGPGRLPDSSPILRGQLVPPRIPACPVAGTSQDMEFLSLCAQMTAPDPVCSRTPPPHLHRAHPSGTVRISARLTTDSTLPYPVLGEGYKRYPEELEPGSRATVDDGRCEGQRDREGVE